MPNYLNFDLHIDKNAATGEYTVKVLYSPAGEMPAPIPFRIPFSNTVLENRLLKLKLALRSAGLIRKAEMTLEEQEVRDFGEELFKAAFYDDVLALYRTSQQQVRAQASGLRVRLRVAPPELAALPWEYLRDPNTGDFICLSANSPVVRYLELPHAAEPLRIALPLRILGVVARPADLPRLDVEGETSRIEDALKPLLESGWLHLEWLRPPTVAALQSAMGQGDWHVLHFIGHGGFDSQQGEGALAMVRSDSQNEHLIPATVLGRILDENRQLRLVFLNACKGARADERDIFSSTAATLVRHRIPAVLAMQYDITDSAAKLLAEVFYRALAEGQSVDAAITRARVAITAQWSQSLEWGTPVLTMRSPDGVLFKVEKQPSPPDPLPKERGEKTPMGMSPAPSKSGTPTNLSDDAAVLSHGEIQTGNKKLPGCLPYMRVLVLGAGVMVALCGTVIILLLGRGGGVQTAVPSPTESQIAANLTGGVTSRPTHLVTLIYTLTDTVIPSLHSSGTPDAVQTTDATMAAKLPHTPSPTSMISPTDRQETRIATNAAPFTAIPSMPTQTPDLLETSKVIVKQTVTAASVASSTQVPTSTFTVTPSMTTTPAPTLTSTFTTTPTLIPTLTETPSVWIPQEQTWRGLSMVYVPTGCFKIGSSLQLDANAQSNEQPQMEICFDESFWIGKFEVSRAQYEQCTQCDSVSPPLDWTNPALPVTNVTWSQAKRYCEWIGGELPTEAQWEYTARGSIGGLYPWKNIIPTITDAIFGRLPTDLPEPVGSSMQGQPSWIGAYHLAGNVAEWTGSTYTENYFNYDPDSRATVLSTEVVIRGGAYSSNAEAIKSVRRGHFTPYGALEYLGFRCVVNDPLPQ